MPGWDPVELEGPEWLDGEKAREDPEVLSRTRARIEGMGEAKHVGPRAISQSPYAPWSRQILTARLGGEGCRGPRPGGEPRPDMTEE